MDEYLKEALEIVKAQASVRNMTEEEITSMVMKLAEGIRNVGDGFMETEGNGNGEPQEAATDPKKAVRDKSITCLECGCSFKTLTKRHLIKYGLTPDEYRDKWGYPHNMPLVCKSLQRERRKKMKEMRLWERRAKK
jgi:predicted transcriptional regulator